MHEYAIICIYFIHHCIIYLLELDHRLVELDSPLFLFGHPKERGCMNCWWFEHVSAPRPSVDNFLGHQWTIVLLELCILCICNITSRHSTSFHADWAKSFRMSFWAQSPGTVAGCGFFTFHLILAWIEVGLYPHFLLGEIYLRSNGNGRTIRCEKLGPQKTVSSARTKTRLQHQSIGIAYCIPFRVNVEPLFFSFFRDYSVAFRESPDICKIGPKMRYSTSILETWNGYWVLALQDDY